MNRTTIRTMNETINSSNLFALACCHDEVETTMINLAIRTKQLTSLKGVDQ